MLNPTRLRFLTTNYGTLQGLKQIPLGLLAILVVQWAGAWQGPATDFTMPLLGLLLAPILYIVIERYYRRLFGHVRLSRSTRLRENLIWTAAGLVAMTGFWADVTFKWPISMLGLCVAAAFSADYVRMGWLNAGNWRAYPSPLLTIGVLILSSLFSKGWILGIEWWRPFGLTNALYATVWLIGLLGILQGIWSHMYLTEQLSPEAGSLHGHAA